ncbi:fibronectin type III domain-containing protein [Cryomorphaceae bacterium 1068]|nr:fibronectin type III domain-containing protein [Cryomorphaceae bacterium 1068]
MAKLKLGIAKLNTSDLIFYCLSVESSMNGNAHFPDPSPTLAEIAVKREKLEALDIKSSDGDRIAIANRNTVTDELKNMLRKLSLYVSFMAEGDANVILTSGFDIRKEANETAPLQRPESLMAKRTDYGGMVKLKWKPVVNSVSNHVEMTTTDPNDQNSEWATVGITSKSKINIGNLTPGTYYWFRVKAYGRRHESPFSDPALIMAA